MEFTNEPLSPEFEKRQAITLRTELYERLQSIDEYLKFLAHGAETAEDEIMAAVGVNGIVEASLAVTFRTGNISPDATLREAVDVSELDFESIRGDRTSLSILAEFYAPMSIYASIYAAESGLPEETVQAALIDFTVKSTIDGFDEAISS